MRVLQVKVNFRLHLLSKLQAIWDLKSNPRSGYAYYD